MIPAHRVDHSTELWKVAPSQQTGVALVAPWCSVLSDFTSSNAYLLPRCIHTRSGGHFLRVDLPYTRKHGVHYYPRPSYSRELLLNIQKCLLCSRLLLNSCIVSFTMVRRSRPGASSMTKRNNIPGYMKRGSFGLRFSRSGSYLTKNGLKGVGTGNKDNFFLTHLVLVPRDDWFYGFN